MRTLVAGGDVLTADPSGHVHADGAVLVDGTRIAAVGPRHEVEAAMGELDDHSGQVGSVYDESLSPV